MLEAGQDVPEDYKDKPEVEPRFRWLYTAFRKLRNHAAEVAGMGAALSAIKPSEIVAWCELNRIDDGELRTTVYEVVTALDAVYLSSKAPKESDEGDDDDGT